MCSNPPGFFPVDVRIAREKRIGSPDDYACKKRRSAGRALQRIFGIQSVVLLKTH